MCTGCGTVEIINQNLEISKKGYIALSEDLFFGLCVSKLFGIYKGAKHIAVHDTRVEGGESEESHLP